LKKRNKNPGKENAMELSEAIREINALMGMEGRRLACLIPVGYPDESPKAPPRLEGRVQWLGF